MTPLVSIVMPCLNEKAHVRRVVENVLSLDIPSGGAELLVIDGMSDDGTREELGALSRENTRLRVLDNEARVTPAALNIGILAAAGEIIIRLDMHTQYQQDYLVRCVEELRSTGAENVGGSWHAVGHTFIQSAIALAFNSPSLPAEPEAMTARMKVRWTRSTSGAGGGQRSLRSDCSTPHWSGTRTTN